VDLNNDGYRDILSGSYSRMESSMAGLFQVLWGEKGGGFKQAAVLKGTDKEPLIIPIKDKSDMVENICTRPTAVDWNGDGKLDLVVGNFAGTFYVFTGEGNGKFKPKPEPLMGVDGGRLKVKGHHGDPFMVDWDGDGDLDMVSGSSEGGVQWAENTGGKKTPALKDFKALIEPGRKYESGQLLSEEEVTEPGDSTRVWVDDFNADGKLDILVGDNITLISLAKGVTKEEYPAKREKWQKALTAASEAMSKATGDDQQAVRKRYSEVYQQRTEFMNEDRTGYVWVYLRK
jgi:hypothetical protein